MQTRRIDGASGGGFLHEPAEPNGDGVILTHGAGGNCQAPLLIKVAEAFASLGAFVLRYNLPFRQRRPYGPPGRSDGEADRQGLRQAASELRQRASGRILLAGHSYGGRQASILAAADREVCDGLILLSYPLHPPDKPADLRTNHFPELRAPALFVHGSKDPFGTVEEMQSARRLIHVTTELVMIERAGHDLLKGNFDVSTLVVNRALNLVGAANVNRSAALQNE